MNKYILSAPYILKKTLLTSFNSSSSVKFFSGNSLEKVFAYEYDLDTLYYVYSKYNLSFDFAKKKLDSLVALKHSKAFLDVKNKKIRELCEIKSDLKSKGYLYYQGLKLILYILLNPSAFRIACYYLVNIHFRSNYKITKLGPDVTTGLHITSYLF